MEKFAFYIGNCTEEELERFLKEAKDVANIVHDTVTVHTATDVYEVHEDEEKEKDVEKSEKKSQEEP